MTLYDASRGRQTTALQFIVNRPAHEPGFRLNRQESHDRVLRYTLLVEKAIWNGLRGDEPLPEHLGELEPGTRSEPVALTQLLLLAHLLAAVR